MGKITITKHDKTEGVDGEFSFSVRRTSDSTIRFKINNKKYFLNNSDLRDLEEEIAEAIQWSSLHTNRLNKSERNNKIDLEFDERILFDSLSNLNGVGEITAIKVLEKLTKRTFDNITKEDIEEVEGVGEKTAPLVWSYLSGFYDGAHY